MAFFHRFSTSDTESIHKLSERMQTLETQIKLLRVEWDEVYDKITHAAERNRKRRGTSVEEPPAPAPADDNVTKQRQLNEVISRAKLQGLL